MGKTGLWHRAIYWNCYYPLVTIYYSSLGPNWYVNINATQNKVSHHVGVRHLSNPEEPSLESIVWSLVRSNEP